MKLQILIVLALAACHLEVTRAVSCKEATAKTCKKSMYVSETCSSDVCECTGESMAGNYGCIKLGKPTVTATSQDIPSSGEFVTGADIKLTCNKVAGKGSVTYKWFKEDLLQAGAALVDYDLSSMDAGSAGNYRCSISAHGVESVKSDAFTLSHVSDKTKQENFKKQPVLNGLPKKAIEGQELTLSCDNVFADAAKPVIKFVTVGKTEVAAKNDNELTFTFDSTKTDKPLCKATPSGSGSATVTSAEGALPEKTDTIQMVVITGPSMHVTGKSLTLTCAIDDADLSENGATWTWTKNNKNVVGAATKKLTLTSLSSSNEGEYKCKATIQAVMKESDGYTVKAVSGVSVKTTATPTKGLLAGYIAMECTVTGAKSDTDIKYAWKKGTDYLYGVYDNIIQMNELNPRDNGPYKCDPIVGGVIVEDATGVFSDAPVDLSAAIKPEVTTSKGSPNYELGKTYTLTCESLGYNDTPGLTYVWKKDTKTMADKGKTLSVEATSTSASYTCQLDFNSKQSAVSNAEDIHGKGLVKVEVLNHGNKVTGGAINPLKDTTVEMECKATVASGVSDKPTYSWKDSTPTEVATTAVYSFKATTRIILECEVTLGAEKMKSGPITVTVGSTIEKPTLALEPAVPELSKGASYTLMCVTPTAAKEIKYEFMRGTTKVGGDTMQYKIESASASVSGTYTCKATHSSVTSPPTSDAMVLTVGAPGKYCTSSQQKTDCAGKEYSGTCTLKRCVCAKDYVAKKEVCADGASSIVISLFGLVLAVLTTRLL